MVTVYLRFKLALREFFATGVTWRWWKSKGHFAEGRVATVVSAEPDWSRIVSADAACWASMC